MKKMFFGISALTLISFAPVASAGYWAGHAEVIKGIIKNWVLENQTRVEQPKAPGQGNPAQPRHLSSATQLRR